MSGPIRVVVCVRPHARGGHSGSEHADRLDRAALAAARRMVRDAGGGEVIALSLGAPDSDAALRRCHAAGADRAVRLDSGGADVLDGVVTARLLSTAVGGLEADLVVCGQRSSEAGHGTVGYELAGSLGWPVVNDCVTLSYQGPSRSVQAIQWSERGDRTTVHVSGSAVLLVREAVERPLYLAVAREARFAETHVEVVKPQSLAHVTQIVEAEYGELTREVITPKIRVKKKPGGTPAKALTAAERRKALAGGGVKKAENDSGPVSADPATAAARIAEFLVEKGVV